MKRKYYVPKGGLPTQDQRLYAPACFTTSYAVIPAHSMVDIVVSFLPLWKDTRAWILARPLTGFAETFSQLIVELAPGGGSSEPEPEDGAEAILFCVAGELTLTIDDQEHVLEPGGYAYVSPKSLWSIYNTGNEKAVFHWYRKEYKSVKGIEIPPSFVTSDSAVETEMMPATKGRWGTSRFTDIADLRHDMHVNIVTVQPGAVIPFAETHVMEHGIYVLQGQGRYLLNTDWVDVGPGDFMWLRAFCPQACESVGSEPFRYLLYKDVNRHPSLRLG